MEHFEKLGIIILVNFLVFWKTIYYGFVGDDVERHERKTEFKNKFERMWIQFVGLKHIDNQLSHFITIITHAICCCMIYLALGSNNISFLTALLFSINPVNMQGSVWISGRNYVTASILTLLMISLPKLSWAFYAATSYFAVNAWFAPLAFLGTPHWYMVGIIPIIWLLNSHNRKILHVKLWENAGLKTTNTEMRAIAPRKIVPFIKTYIYYFILCIFPFGLGIEHDYLRGFGTNKTDNYKGYKKSTIFWLGLTVFSLVVGASIWCIFNGWNPVIWGLFWFTINIAMWCNFVTYQQQIAERYVYLANIGMMYALANLIIASPWAISAFLTGYFVRLWYIMDIYMNDWWAVEYTIREFKKGHYMWLMRGVKKFMQKDHLGALYDFNEAYNCKPYDLKILYNLSTTYFLLGDIGKAREFYEKAKLNVYDELEKDVKPAFDNLEASIKHVEEARAKGETQVQIDLSKIMVVK